MGSIRSVGKPSAGRLTSEVRLLDERVSELDEIGRRLGEVYAVFRGHLPPQAWERYIGEIVDVRGRPGESELIDTEIGEMFTRRPLPPGQSRQAQAYRLDLEGV